MPDKSVAQGMQRDTVYSQEPPNYILSFWDDITIVNFEYLKK